MILDMITDNCVVLVFEIGFADMERKAKTQHIQVQYCDPVFGFNFFGNGHLV